jgi:hypothetical protein
VSTHAESSAGDETAAPGDAPRRWWEDRRGACNLALIASFAGAFVAYCGAVELCNLLSADVDAEVSLVTILGGAIVFAVFVGVATVCYELGALAERVVRPADPPAFRRRLYRAGLVFSVLLPWVNTAVLVVQCLTAPRVASA